MTTERLPAPPRGSVIVPASVALGALALAAGTAAGPMMLGLMVFLACIAGGLLIAKGGMQWRTMLGGILLLIMFVPINRYALPGSLAFQIEPYRLAVALAFALWFAALLVDPRVRLRASGLEPPIAFLMAVVLASVIANPARVSELSGDVAKSLTFFSSFIIFFFMFVSVVRTRAGIDLLLRILVGSGAVVAALTTYEGRSHYNVFDHLSAFIPVLKLTGSPYVPERGGLDRAYGSGQHPIATGAVFVMLIPVAIYLYGRAERKWPWALAVVALLLGSMATISKTSVVMLVVVLVVYLWLRPRETRRLWPAVIPLLLVVHIALPGTIGSLKSSFFPEEGFIAQNSANAGYRGSARLADVGPALREWQTQPLLGKGYGTLIVTEGRENALILDDQWLGTLLEIGALGALAYFWLISRSVRQLAVRARRDRSDLGLLFVGLAAAILSFAIGMATYDAFAFIQVTFLMFILMAVGCAALKLPGPDDDFRRPVDA